MLSKTIPLAVALILLAPMVPAQSDGSASRDVETARFRSQSTLVLVPTLVTTKSGEIVYGLSAKDFAIEDDGLGQDVIASVIFGLDGRPS